MDRHCLMGLGLDRPISRLEALDVRCLVGLKRVSNLGIGVNNVHPVISVERNLEQSLCPGGHRWSKDDRLIITVVFGVDLNHLSARDQCLVVRINKPCIKLALPLRVARISTSLQPALT